MRSLFRSAALTTSLISSLVCFAACGGSSSDDLGLASVVLTDAASDEVDVFQVDVESIVFHRVSGASVSVMPRRTRVDFAELQTVSELLVGASLPAGLYQSITMTLDFSQASVYLAGQTTPATVLDENGAMITGDVAVEVAFSTAERPEIIVGRNHTFVLDLDLNQALAVNMGSNEVTFMPVLSAEIDPSAPKPVALRGHLTAVDEVARTVQIEKRDINGGVIGTTTVNVTPLTVYQVDGVVYVGASGLAALAPLAVGQVVYAQGALRTQDARLIGVAIEAGFGTRGNGQDWVIGHITARDVGAGNDATLTVMGRSWDDPAGPFRFNTQHTVRVSLANTKVLRRGSGNSLDSDALNVGQRIIAFGVFDPGLPDLDATDQSGVVRMLRTHVFGLANGPAAGDTVTLNVSRIGLRAIGAFDFDVNGNVQSDPSAFTVDVTGLSTGGITTGTKTQAIGWMNPVDVGADDDMDAETLIDNSNGALLLTQWTTGSLGTITPTTSEVTLTDITSAPIKIVADGFGGVTLTSSPAPTIVPALPLGIYRIVEDGAVEVHLTFGGFANALNARLATASEPFRVAALGSFDAPTQVMTSLIVTVVLL